jgi:methionyl aminopeptidase
MYPVKPVPNIGCHDIEGYHVHAPRPIPFVKDLDRNKIEEGEIFAIETFRSMGRDCMVDGVSFVH